MSLGGRARGVRRPANKEQALFALGQTATLFISTPSTSGFSEDLVRVRRPDERERYAAAQPQACIDPNPHQIDP